MEIRRIKKETFTQKTNMETMKTIVGIRPTGRLHIGHYFSVIKPALEENADVLVARYHAPGTTDEIVKNLISTLRKFEIQRVYDQKYTFFAPNYFYLISVARKGELERMTQYKNAKVKSPHLLVYPILMAHDLMPYSRVIVGDDQKQHVEYANVLFKRLGIKPIKGDYRGGRIMSLNDPTKKMSKSEPKGCIFLDDSEKDVESKIKRAVTTPAGIKNLANISRLLGVTWDPKNNLESKKTLTRVIILDLIRNEKNK
jgi:tryptophanyl-tRNA synthetase